MGKLTLAVFGTVTAVLVYSAYEIGPFFYDYMELENQMQSVIRVAGEYTDAEIRQKLLYHIKKMEIPADPEQLRIERYANSMKISLPYQEVFYVTYRGKDYDLYTFKFNAAAEGNF